MPREFPAAPWSTTLIVVSMLTTCVLPVAAVAAFRSIPAQTGFTHLFGLLVAAGPPALLGGALLFTVRGFAVDGERLLVRRLLWSTPVSLVGLRSVRHDPEACRRSLRVWGNGGLYSFTGLFRSSRLGTYRLFATDREQAVVLDLPGRPAVVTPAAPEAFVEHVRATVPMFPGDRSG